MNLLALAPVLTSLSVILESPFLSRVEALLDSVLSGLFFYFYFFFLFGVTLPLSGRGASGLCPLRSLFFFSFFPNTKCSCAHRWPHPRVSLLRGDMGERERESKRGKERDREERERARHPGGGGRGGKKKLPEDLSVSFSFNFRLFLASSLGFSV